MTELSPDARRILAKLLDTATFSPVQNRGRGDVYVDAAPVSGVKRELRVGDVPRSAWVELIALTGKPDDAYAEDGSRLGRVIAYVGGVPVIDVDG